MDKYAVDEEAVDLEKRAADGCPICGQRAERHGKLLFCPTHGSEPFETKEKSDV